MPHDPAVDARRWVAYMRRGRYSEAWHIGDKVLRGGAPVDLPRHLQIVWRGQRLQDRDVTILCYRGLGDTIHFIRYVPMVKAAARRLTVIAQAQLLPLLRTMPAVDHLRALDGEENSEDAGVEVEVTELPYVFRTTLDTIPAQIPYFHVPVAPLPRAKGLLVGLVWASGDWDGRRNISARHVASLAEVPGVTFYSFQRGAAARNARAFGAIELEWEDIIHEAGLLRSLDLLISVDTMPAHLAGALGVPVWLLLHSQPDWRWMLDREDSPWYPTMRLFRQRRAGAWTPVIERVADALRALAQSENSAAAKPQPASPSRHKRRKCF